MERLNELRLQDLWNKSKTYDNMSWKILSKVMLSHEIQKVIENVM